MAADRIVDEFFSGYERVYTPMDVAERLFNIPLYDEVDTPIAPTVTVETNTAVKYCVSCKEECPESSKFCMKCGGKKFANSIDEIELLRQIAELKKENEEISKNIKTSTHANQPNLNIPISTKKANVPIKTPKSNIPVEIDKSTTNDEKKVK